MACHHGDYDPQTVEAVLVTAADALSAARPGARREVLETYVKRLEKLEEIASNFKGVQKTFAIQAGREIRIIVDSGKIGDEQALWLSKDIARKIEAELTYPGQIKVTVIRETRSVEYARMKLLFVGDVFGKPGRRALANLLPRLVDQHRADYVVVNVENSAGGFGVTPEIMAEFARPAASTATPRGNHIWDKKEGVDLLDRIPNLLRPANYPEGNPGKGVHVGETAAGIPVAVINLEGRVFMNALESPFVVADRLLEKLRPAGQGDLRGLPRRGHEREAGHGLPSGRPGERRGRHPHPRAHRRRAHPPHGHRLPDRRRDDRPLRVDHRIRVDKVAQALPAPDPRLLRSRQARRAPGRSADRHRRVHRQGAFH